MKELAEFLKRELVSYIVQELKKGHSLEAIKRSLVKAGHHKDLVEEVLFILKKNNFHLGKALQTPVRYDAVKRALYVDVLQAVTKYIEHMLVKGYTLEEIKRLLVGYGHTTDVVDAALKVVMRQDPIEKIDQEEKAYGRKAWSLAAAPLCFATAIIFVLWLATVTNSDIIKVSVGFLPLFASVIISGVLVHTLSARMKTGLLLVPILSAAVLYYTATQGYAAWFAGMEVALLTGLNGIFGVILASIILTARYEPKKRL
ncbi:hypothetical protein HZB02_05710 [Candidatus Woesearchaeota archaeon]|nr:hypothetical protein [Candidatus Woesearchaeota archaeon]